MGKITYVPCRQGKPKRMTVEKYAELRGMEPDELVRELKEAHGETMWEMFIPFAEGIECPFGVRDLMNDTCYIGSNVHRCKYFSRYVHDGEHAGTIECRCDKPRKGSYVQLELF